MRYEDVSWATSAAVTRPRQLPRVGIALHESVGLDSLKWLQGESVIHGRPVSSDFLIARMGTIYQVTKPNYYAFHTGEAMWRNYQEKDKSCNQGLVGIELENHPDRGQKVTTSQYIALAWLIRQLMTEHNISFRDITTHAEIAIPTGRKSDPKTLNWLILSREILYPSKEASDFKPQEVYP